MIQSISFFSDIDQMMIHYYRQSLSESMLIEMGYTQEQLDKKGVNTWNDWHILASERPVFAPPKQKTHYIDIPGGNGSLDLSESLTGYPVYNNRSGSFTFRVMNDYGGWSERYSEIMGYLHGQSMCAVLADDDKWFYHGRFVVEEWNSADTWSEITIGYEVNPFKWMAISSTDPWLWDPFNFDTDMIMEQTFKNMVINSPSSWTEFCFVSDFFGSVPFSPTITVSGAPLTGIDIRFINKYLGIDITQNFKNGSVFVPDFIFYGQKTPYKMLFRGSGTVSMNFRSGRL